MSLLRLPTEIVQLILDQVGSLYFQEDWRRLTICKDWYTLARKVGLKEIQFNYETLKRLLSSSNVDTSLRLLKENTESLNIDLISLNDPENIPELASRSEDWPTALDKYLLEIANELGLSRKLRRFRFRAYPLNWPPTWEFRSDYLEEIELKPFLLMNHLTILEVDLCCNIHNSRFGGYGDESNHVCPYFGDLLPSLTRLYLRLNCICTKALTHRQTDGKLKLRDLVVNLSIAHGTPEWGGYPYTTLCSVTRLESPQPLSMLQKAIEGQAAVLAARMDSPRIVRVLYPVATSWFTDDTRSFDILTGKRMRMTSDMAWDDDGEIIVYWEDE